MVFKKLGIIEPILKVIEKEGFEEPSEIQIKAIPLTIEGKDIIAGSATGSGKTLAFGCRLIENAQIGKGIQGLVLTPTRELAEQVMKALQKFSKYKHLEITSVYGGVAINPQMEKLMKADIVVGTPGRLLDHIERRTINLTRVNMLVLDEADRMLDMGFKDDVERIIRQCPKNRQTLLFSATISREIASIAKQYMRDAIRVNAEEFVDPKKLNQVYYDIPDNQKFSLLVHLLKHEEQGLVMVFSNTRRNVDFIAKNLKGNGVDALGIHGGFTQAKRNHVMERFHSGKAFILVCTDVAARGLDIPHISHVYNYDIPNDSKEYVHRIGRTARAGNEGKVINLLSHRDHENFSRVLRDNHIDIKKEVNPENMERANVKTESRQQRGGPRRFGSSGPRNRSGFGRRPGNRFGNNSGPRSNRPRSHSGPKRSKFTRD